MKIIVTNAKLKVEYFSESTELQKYINKEIAYQVNPLDPDRFNKKAFRMHVWDGRVKLFNPKVGEAPSGLFSDVLKAVKNCMGKYPTINLDTVDRRGSKLETVHKVFPKDSKYKLKEDEPELTLRDHQIKGVQFAMDNQLGTINYATASGKSAVAFALIGELLPKLKANELIFLTEKSVSLAKQLKTGIELALGIKVGMWGAGKEDIQQVTVATCGTMASGLKPPEDTVKLTSLKDKVTQHFAKDYVPLFIDQDNAKALIKTYLMNHQPRYKYDVEIFNQLNEIAKLPTSKIQKALKWQAQAYDKLLKKKAKKAYDKYNQTKDILNRVRAVIVDEAHEAAANSYQLALLNMPNARLRIGLTGTVPSHTENMVRWTKFKGIFGDNIIKVSNHEMIEKGFAAKPTIKLVPINQPVKLDNQIDIQLPPNLPKRMQPLAKYQLAYKLGIINNSFRNKLIELLTKKLVALKNGPVLIIVSEIDHGEILQSGLQNLGIPSKFIYGDKTMDERQEIFDLIKNNQSPVLIGTQLLDTGIDIPNLKYLIYVSGGKSIRQVLQRIGRMLRKTANKKTTTIFDLQDHTTNILYKQAQARVKIYQDEQFEIEG